MVFLQARELRSSGEQATAAQPAVPDRFLDISDSAHQAVSRRSCSQVIARYFTRGLSALCVTGAATCACRCDSGAETRLESTGGGWAEPAEVLAAAAGAHGPGCRRVSVCSLNQKEDLVAMHLAKCGCSYVYFAQLHIHADASCLRHRGCRTFAIPENGTNRCAGDVKPAFDAAAVQAELRSAQPDVIAAAQAFTAGPEAVRSLLGPCIPPSALYLDECCVS